jgi:hypothetical protein
VLQEVPLYQVSDSEQCAEEHDRQRPKLPGSRNRHRCAHSYSHSRPVNLKPCHHIGYDSTSNRTQQIEHRLYLNSWVLQCMPAGLVERGVPPRRHTAE